MPESLWNLIHALFAWPLTTAATLCLLALWFRGSLFDSCRAWFEARRDDPTPGRAFAVGRFAGQLFTCPFCLSFHLSGAVVLVAMLSGVAPREPVAIFLYAATEIAAFELFQLTDRY